MDLMSFETGLEPKRDLVKNAQSSPFFAKLPPELRNAVYTLIFKQALFEKDAPRGLLSPAALRTCRQFYGEAVKILYGCNVHSFSIDPDMVIYRAVPRIPSQFTSTSAIGMIRHVELKLQLPKQGNAPHISMDSVNSAGEHLRGICLSLSSSGAVLRSLTVTVLNGHMLDYDAAFELLDTLKELRVDGEVHVLGIEADEGERYEDKRIHELVGDIKDEMVAPDTMDEDGRSQVTIRCMCQDLWDYTNLCIQHVKDWPTGSTTDNERDAAVQELEQVFDVGMGLRGEMHFPVGSRPIEVFRAALWSIEALYAQIDQTRFAEYYREATRARERLYMRKAFREMVPHAVPDVYAFD